MLLEPLEAVRVFREGWRWSVCGVVGVKTHQWGVLIKSRWAHLCCTPIPTLICHCSNLQNKTINMDLSGRSFISKRRLCEIGKRRELGEVVIRRKGNQRLAWVRVSCLLISSPKTLSACYRVQVVFQLNPRAHQAALRLREKKNIWKE